MLLIAMPPRLRAHAEAEGCPTSSVHHKRHRQRSRMGGRQEEEEHAAVKGLAAGDEQEHRETELAVFNSL